MAANFLDRLFRTLERALGILLIAAVALNFANVVGRYAFGVVMISADELEIFALVIMTFIGAAIVTWRRQNLRMDVLRTLLPSRFQRAVGVAEAVVSILIAGFMVYVSYQYVRKVVLLEQVSDMAQIPMWIPHGAVLLGFALIALAQVVRGIAALLPGEVVTEESAEAAAAAVATAMEPRR